MKEIHFHDRVAIVTGAGGGLGRAYAMDLASRGASVVVNDLGVSTSGQGRDSTAAQRVAEEIIAAGGRAVASHDSVATRAGGTAIVTQAMDIFGRVDILINNAGFVRNGAFGDISDEDLDALIDVHLKGAVYVTQPAYRVMCGQRYGRLIFTSSSTAAFGADADQVAYAAAKAGLIGLAYGVSNSGLSFGVTANVLLPTAMSRLAGEANQEKTEKFAPIVQLLGNSMEPRFVTPLVTYLCSEQCTVTHRIFSATAGRYARVSIGAASGWLGPRTEPASAEQIAANFDVIDSTAGHQELHSVAEEFGAIVKRITESQ